MLHVRFLIGLIVGWLCCTACQAPPPTPMTQPTVSPQPRPTVSPQPLPTFTSSVADSAWQVWHVSFFPKTIYSLAFQDDLLWVGTEYGLWRLDPKTNRIVHHNSQLGEVHLLLPIENGQAWAGASQGVFFFDGQAWHTITLPDTASLYQYRHYIHMLAIDQAGDLSLATVGWRGGINSYRYHGHIPTDGAMVLNQAANDYRLADPADCQQWPILAHVYLQPHRSAEECRALQLASQTIPPASPATRLTLDADGSVWRTDLNDNTVSRWVNGTRQPVDLPAGTRVTAVVSDPTRGVWIGTNRGLVYAAGTEVRWLPDLEQYFTLGRPIDLSIEASGDVWVQTAESTLNRLPADRSSPQFEAIANVGARAMAASDGLWITHGTDLVHLKLGDPPSASAQPPVLDDCKLDRLTIDRAGDVWTTTRCGVAWQYQPATSRWIRHALTKPAPLDAEFDPIQRIVASTDGTVYAVGLNGLGELTAAGDVITATAALTATALPQPTYRHRALFPSGDSLVNHAEILRDSQSAADREGGIWLAVINQPELWHYSDGQATPLAHPLSGQWLSELHVDQRGWLWEVGIDQQLAAYDGQAWRTVTTPDLGIVRRTASDPDERLWLVGDRGIAVYDPAKDDLP